MDSQALRPPPTQSMWVPFPGTKRKAESEIFDKECGPAPPKKQFAADKGDFGWKNGTNNLPFISGRSGQHSFRLTPPPETPPGDEDMKEFGDDEGLDPPLSECSNFAGASSHPSSCFIGDGGGHCGQHEHGNMDDNDDDDEFETMLTDSPKLYLTKELKGVLSKKPDDELRTLSERVFQATSPSLAMVLWKPPEVISSIDIFERETPSTTFCPPAFPRRESTDADDDDSTPENQMEIVT